MDPLRDAYPPVDVGRARFDGTQYRFRFGPTVWRETRSTLRHEVSGFHTPVVLQSTLYNRYSRSPLYCGPYLLGPSVVPIYWDLLQR